MTFMQELTNLRELHILTIVHKLPAEGIFYDEKGGVH
jgi:hypothetical protein